MELKRYNIEPTEENVLDSLLRDATGRNDALFSFLEIIGCDSVSSLVLDGDWGSGKTFFVKQAVLLMEYMSPDSNLNTEVRRKLDRFFEAVGGAHNRRPRITPCRVVYYDAWLYDDHADPIQSLLYSLSVTFKKSYSLKQPDAVKTLLAFVKTIAKWVDLDALVESFQTEDASMQVQTLEDMKNLLQEAFHELLQDIYTLVIVVDELDRCKPTYAVRFLERMKHFFDCPNVKFVFAANVRQLEASIQCFYGNRFESTKYLNKFFDFTVELPSAALPRYLNKERSYSNDMFFHSLCHYLGSYFSFPLRDLNIFLGIAENLEEKIMQQVKSCTHVNTSRSFSYLFFPPILVALSISNRADYVEVATGNRAHIILDIFNGWSEGIRFAKIALPGAKNSNPVDIQNMISKLYVEIFKSRSGPSYNTINNQKSVIFKLISKL